MDEDLKSMLLDIYRDWAPDEAALAAFDRMLEEMWRICLDRGAFGYSAHYEAIVWELPELFRIVKPLLKDMGQLERFCRAIPNIVQWLPYTSEEGPMGYTHTILLYPFRERAATSPDFESFIKGFEGERVTACRECGRDMKVERSKENYCLTCECGATVIC